MSSIGIAESALAAVGIIHQSAALKTERLDPYHYMRSLTYFEDAETEPDPRMLVPWSWKDIKSYFKSVITEWRLLP